MITKITHIVKSFTDLQVIKISNNRIIKGIVNSPKNLVGTLVETFLGSKTNKRGDL